mmetsp:Transcript_22927/g.73376  ORF Transcript_22927/g.73376 Transcript_22927/m.73376 type:complete len:445 (+) Transcript_22927:399-1733(+)
MHLLLRRPAGYSNGRCSVQCYTGGAVNRTDCTREPAGAVVIGGSSEWASVPKDQWLQWLLLGLVGLGLILLVSCVRDLLCPAGGSVSVLTSLSFVLGITGLSLAAASVYIGWFDGVFGATIFVGLLGENAAIALTTFGAGVFALSMLSLVGICLRSPRAMLLSFVLQLGSLVVEFVAAVLVAYWVWSLHDVAADSIQSVSGEGEGRFDGRFGEAILSEVEGIVCRTYQLCCRDPQLDEVQNFTAAAATCMELGEGESDLLTILSDASSPQFCRYISGSSSTAVPSAGTCGWLDGRVINQEKCQAEFCASGAEGYLTFIEELVAWMQRNALPVGAALSVIVLVQCVALANAWQLRRRFQHEVRELRARKRRKQRRDDLRHNDEIRRRLRREAEHLRREEGRAYERTASPVQAPPSTRRHDAGGEYVSPGIARAREARGDKAVMAV